jgi:hypothetical protein
MVTKYEIIMAKPAEISLMKISGNGGSTTSLEMFGPSSLDKVVTDIKKPYSHPTKGVAISLREPTTTESIMRAAPIFSSVIMPKLQYLDGDHISKRFWFNLGRVILGSEGVYVNPLKDEKGEPITDEKFLKASLSECKKVGNVWLYQGDVKGALDFGYAPLETFKDGEQDLGDFLNSGLARVLENSRTPKNLRKIFMKKFGKKVNVN